MSTLMSFILDSLQPRLNDPLIPNFGYHVS